MSNNKNSSMEKRRFRPQSRPLPRRGRTSWPRNIIDDIWRRQKLQNRFLLLLRSKVTNRLNQVRFPFQGHVSEGHISALMCCRHGRRDCPIVQVSDSCQLGTSLLLIDVPLFCQNFKHLLIQLTCEHQLDFVLNSGFMIHHKIALLQSRSQASFHSCQ